MEPTFHLFDESGWVNDPNGPLYYNGRYHMFFQNVEDSTTWTWGLSWGHATSTDLLHWRQQPAALKPDPGWHDADGCFSGCATVDVDGRPAILYTGVRKKPDAAEREGMPMTVSKLCYETQLIARPQDPSDPDLKEWVKVPQPFLPDDTSGLPTHCFRDPFVLEKPCEANGWRWRVMVGSNISSRGDTTHQQQQQQQQLPTLVSEEPSTTNSSSSSSSEQGDSTATAADADAAAGVSCGAGDVSAAAGGHEETMGTATVYRSKTQQLEDGWEFDGLLCVAQPGDGAIWECPIMVPLQPDSQHPAATAAASTALPAAAAPDSSSPQPSAPLLPGTTAAVFDGRSQQQQQQQLELERATSGCLGLWSGSPTRSNASGDSFSFIRTNSNSNSSGAGGGAAAAAAGGGTAGLTGGSNTATTPQHQQQEEAGGVVGPPTHLFSVSAGVCPAIYWLGRYADGRFDLSAASGPHALDLGDVLYAPNLMEDAQGRQIIWAWCQDHPSPVSHDYAGCISLPRQLLLGVQQHRRSNSSNHSNSRQGAPSATSSATHTLSTPPQQQQQQDTQQQSDAAAGLAADKTNTAASSSGAANSHSRPDSISGGGSGGGGGGAGGPLPPLSDSVTEYYLIQRPLPELAQLRSGRGLRLKGIVLPAGHVWSLPSQVSASHLDLNLTLQPRPGVRRLQILLGPLRKHGNQQQQQQQQGSDASPAGPLQDSSSSTTSAAGVGGGSSDGQHLMQQAYVPVARNISGPGLGQPGPALGPGLMSGTAAGGGITLGDFTSGALSSSSNTGLAAAAAATNTTTPAAAAAAAVAAGDTSAAHGSSSRSSSSSHVLEAGIDSFIGSGFSGGSGSRGVQGIGFSGLQGVFASPPDSPAEQQREVLPWVPAAHHAAAAAEVGHGVGSSGVAGADSLQPPAAAAAAAGAAFGSFTGASEPASGDSSSTGGAAAVGAGAGAAVGADRAAPLQLPASPSTPTSAQQGGSAAASPPAVAAAAAASPAAALAAAAAAEALAAEHWQAAALTYDWDTAQLQVLVGPPEPLMKLLKQQADDLAAAEDAAAAGGAVSTAAEVDASVTDQNHSQNQHHQQQQQQMSRTGTPTPEKLGYQTPALPPAPSGALADSIAAAQAAGLRVLACQLRGLGEGEPLVVRMLLDYSILEVFFGTGEALTTRVYRGPPTARAAEMAARRSAATLSALEAPDDDSASEVSMSGSLANLGLLLHHTHSLNRSGSSVSSPVGSGGGGRLGLLQHSASANARQWMSPSRHSSSLAAGEGNGGIRGGSSRYSSTGSLTSLQQGSFSPKQGMSGPRIGPAGRFQTGPGGPAVGRHSLDSASDLSPQNPASTAAGAGFFLGHAGAWGLGGMTRGGQQQQAGGAAGGNDVSSPVRRSSFDPTLPSTAEVVAGGGGQEEPLAAAPAPAAATAPATADPNLSALFQTAHHQQQQQQQQMGPVAMTATATALPAPFSPPPPRGSVSTGQAGPAVPPSPAGAGPYVHYFSPSRSLAAKVVETARPHEADALLPSLQALTQQPAATAATAAAGAEAAGGVKGMSADPAVTAAAGGEGSAGVTAGGVVRVGQEGQAARTEGAEGGAGSMGEGSRGQQQRQRRLFAEASFNAGAPASAALGAADPLAAAAGAAATATAAGAPSGSAVGRRSAGMHISSSSSSSASATKAPAAHDHDFFRLLAPAAPSETADIAGDAARAAAAAQLDMFPGFSPHKAPPTQRLTSSSGSSMGGTSGSSGTTAGALVTWFQKKISSKGKRGEGAAGGQQGASSSSGSSGSTTTSVRHQIVLPANFGVPPVAQPPKKLALLTPAAPAAAASAGQAADVSPAARDQTKQQQQQFGQAQKQKQAGTAGSSSVAAAAATDQASIPTQGADGPAAATAAAAAAAPLAFPALPSLQIRTSKQPRVGPAPPGAAAAAAAVGGGSSGISGVSAEDEAAAAAGGGVLSPTAVRSPRSARAAVRSPGARRNWRAAFVFDDSELPANLDPLLPLPALTSFDSWPAGLARTPFTTTTTTSGSSSSSHTAAAVTGGAGAGAGSSSAAGSTARGVSWPALEGDRILMDTTQQQPQGFAGSAGEAVGWEAEYGLYAQLLAPGGGRQGRGAAAGGWEQQDLSDSRGDGMGSNATSAKAGVRLGLGGAAGNVGGGLRQSGYTEGSMREVSLVALGGGGVLVDRLEAYEMASMWASQEPAAT